MKDNNPNSFTCIRTKHRNNYLHNGRALLIAISSLLPFNLFAAQVIPVDSLNSAPIIDGNFADWSTIQAVTVPLHKTSAEHISDVPSVSVKAAIYQDSIYIYFSWQDTTESNEHKPFIWNEQQGRYLNSNRYEDRLAIQFEMSGDYTTNWLSGNSFIADTWHWKAFRSNSIGLAHDKITIISDKKLLRSYPAQSEKGTPLYIKRSDDAGDRLYKSVRYRQREQDKMPKYELMPSAQGSIADVKAQGQWQDDHWQLEMTRKLNTHHEDDVVFTAGMKIKAGIAVFDATGDQDHVISDTLIFQF